jgi:hypothetical protein
VIRAVCVEPDRASAHSPGLHLDAQQTPVRGNDRAQVKGETASERHEHVDACSDELVQDPGFSGIASKDCVHARTVTARPDEHMFALVYR